MPVTLSPLRYPGGKTQLAPLVIEILRSNGLFHGQYIEPFAGGAGIACKLLLEGYVSQIHINDLDPAIYSFWRSILTEPDRFCRRIESTKITMAEWRKQKRVQERGDADPFALGFSTFFLNRTNRSGIISGGVIGGQEQKGDYPLDCRFNKKDLIRKIERLAARAQDISVTNLDARVFLKRMNERALPQALVNIDPPYFQKGPELYRNSFEVKDHEKLAAAVVGVRPLWMVTYDDTKETRELYRRFPRYSLALYYWAQVKRIGVELLVLDPRLKVPRVTLSPVAA